MDRPPPAKQRSGRFYFTPEMESADAAKNWEVEVVPGASGYVPARLDPD